MIKINFNALFAQKELNNTRSWAVRNSRAIFEIVVRILIKFGVGFRAHSSFQIQRPVLRQLFKAAWPY